jgi:hypothetical protein
LAGAAISIDDAHSSTGEMEGRSGAVHACAHDRDVKLMPLQLAVDVCYGRSRARTPA